MKLAKRGVVTSTVKKIAKDEKVNAERVRNGVAKGKIVVMEKGEEVCGIGAGLRTKVNANVGTSTDFARVEEEVRKVKAAVEAGTDTVMDLSTGGNLEAVLKRIIRASRVPVGTVPVYSAFVNSFKKGELPREEDILKAVERHMQLGVNFVTVHAAMRRKGLDLTKSRIMRIVSRGGCMLAAWMMKNEKENPLYTNFDYLLELAEDRDVILSLGDALRPGCLSDSTDRAQMHELITQGELVKRAHERNVSVICEGPGHVPIEKIEANIMLQKKICSGAPFYVLGPLVTDIAVGYDHISSAIGGAIAAKAGADFLCVVTPSEHVALPRVEDVVDGVVAMRIAAHAADIAKRMDNEVDLEMSKARAELDWRKQFDCAIYDKKAREYRKKRGSRSRACSMCGDYCAIKIMKELEGVSAHSKDEQYRPGKH
ncbi:MAG: Phosphomethylpyrimidine synthase ThiC [Candidatus Fermentimicrarchaeum limneticum]|uniref:Phosphomethylpyrimidine synthase n=1 Tax=Fermentimicrarchaeum limneticum TaxID=2795018 RepID=A0A7D6BHK4_FERL1|nr:MAG: Phosphomethylpyrimidine synthase ThiC [Candidatus Fermentimicrarchaeum limneticum]